MEERQRGRYRESDRERWNVPVVHTHTLTEEKQRKKGKPFEALLEETNTHALLWAVLVVCAISTADVGNVVVVVRHGKGIL